MSGFLEQNNFQSDDDALDTQYYEEESGWEEGSWEIPQPAKYIQQIASNPRKGQDYMASMNKFLIGNKQLSLRLAPDFGRPKAVFSR